MFQSPSVRPVVWIQSNILHHSRKNSDSQGHTKRVTFSFPDDSSFPWGWVKACVKSQMKHNITLTVLEEESEFYNATFDIPMSIAQGKILPAHDWGTNCNEGCYEALEPDDFIHLPHLHEVELVHGLKRRFNSNQIYTYAGPILIAVNPFEANPEVYDAQHMKRYHFMSTPDSLPPHVFSVAERAYRSILARQNQRQSILLSGESGSGKTLTSKFIMSYLVEASLRHASADKRFEQPLLSCNLILESLFNARTIHNDNSSRFGKYVEMFFNPDGALLGAKVESHLFEKNRLVQQGPGERNFHIFYELLAGATSMERELYLLEDTDAQDFVMTCYSGTLDRRDKVSDADQFYNFKEAMTQMDFSEQEQHDVLQLIAALLHVSNLSVVEFEEGVSELDSNNPCLPAALELLGISIDDLNRAICCITVEGYGETFLRSQPVAGAEKSIEDLIKALYSAFFDFIMYRVNSGCSAGHLDPQLHNSIGLFDVFGFECYQKNSLEQMCANYCNEVLQLHFNFFMFQLEKEEYMNEGKFYFTAVFRHGPQRKYTDYSRFTTYASTELSWDLFSIPDNQETLDVIEHGVFSIIEHQCRLPGANDESFSADLYEKCSLYSSFEANPGMKCFSIKHFARQVEYDTLDFVNKNKNVVSRGTVELLASSSNTFVRRLGAIIMKDTVEGSYDIDQRSTKRATTVETLKRQLHLLIHKIDDASPHFIRCVKPNCNFAPGSFNSGLVAAQLRFSGVLEVLRLSREGYSQRFLHRDFISRYNMLLPMKYRNNSGVASLYSLCQCICADPSFAIGLSGGVRVGKHKIFLTLQASNNLEFARSQQLQKAVVKIQTVWRKCLAERCFIITYCCVLMLQSHCRRLLSKKSVDAMLAKSDKRGCGIQRECTAAEQVIFGERNATQQQLAQNAEMRYTIKWLAQNVEELRKSMESEKRCYDDGSANVVIPLPTQFQEKFSWRESNVLEKENEYLRQNLNKMNCMLREITKTSHRRHGEVKETAINKSAVVEMQILWKHVEHMKQDIHKKKSHIKSLEPLYERTLKMRDAATNEIRELEKERQRLNLHRLGRSSASLHALKIA